jgi:hypothetical protein
MTKAVRVGPRQFQRHPEGFSVPTIDELISDIAKGEIKLPEFQRGYVWNRDKVRRFVQSLYRGHPTGHLLMWHAYGPVQTRGGQSEHEGKTLLLLDGQQRLTSLYALIKGKPPPFYEGEELFFDLWFNLTTDEFSYYAPTVMHGNPIWISVHDFLRKGLNQFLDELPTLTQEQQELAQKSLARLNRLDKIRSYNYQVDDLKDDTLVLDEVVEIFNQVNSEGTPLSRADLAMAHICTFWPDGRTTLRLFVETMRTHGFNIDPSFLIRATSAVAGGSVNFDRSFYQVSGESFRSAWPKVKSSFEYLVNILRHDAYVDSLADLASPIVLVPMIVFLAKNGSTFASSTEQNEFLRWMYLANIWGRYSGPTDTKLQRDIASLSEANPVEALIGAIVTDRGRIEVTSADLQGKGSTSAFYKFAYIIARSRGAKDWFTGQTLYHKAIGKSNGLHSHHIFPQAVLKKMGVTERTIVNQIANRAFLTAKANQKILAQEPRKYLPEVEKGFPGSLRQQHVPMDEGLWEKVSYLDFFERRRRLLARAMNSFLAKLGTSGNAAAAIAGIESLLQSPESQSLEFKSSLRWDYEKGYTNKELEAVVVKTVVGFLNSDGGNLVIGVSDEGEVLGIEVDYDSSASLGDRDGFERHLNGILRRAIGDARLTFVTQTFHSVNGKDICQVSIEPADSPVYIDTQAGEAFCVRQGNATRAFDPKQTMDYAALHWKTY